MTQLIRTFSQRHQTSSSVVPPSLYSCHTALHEHDMPSTIYVLDYVSLTLEHCTSKMSLTCTTTVPAYREQMKTAYCTTSGTTCASRLGGQQDGTRAFTTARSHRAAALAGRRVLAGSPAPHGSRTMRPSGASVVHTPSAACYTASQHNGTDSRPFGASAARTPPAASQRIG